MVSELKKEIDKNTLHRDKEDDWVWCDDDTQEYVVKLAYSKLKTENSVKDGFKFDEFSNTKALLKFLHGR